MQEKGEIIKNHTYNFGQKHPKTDTVYWLMNLVIYLILRRNNCCYKLKKLPFLGQNDQVKKIIKS